MTNGVATEAIVVGFHHFHDLTHLAIEGSFDRFRLTFTSRDAAHVGGVDIELTGYAAVKTSDMRRQAVRRCTNIPFVIAHDYPPSGHEMDGASQTAPA